MRGGGGSLRRERGSEASLFRGGCEGEESLTKDLPVSKKEAWRMFLGNLKVIVLLVSVRGWWGLGFKGGGVKNIWWGFGLGSSWGCRGVGAFGGEE